MLNVDAMTFNDIDNIIINTIKELFNIYIIRLIFALLIFVMVINLTRRTHLQFGKLGVIHLIGTKILPRDLKFLLMLLLVMMFKQGDQVLVN